MIALRKITKASVMRYASPLVFSATLLLLSATVMPQEARQNSDDTLTTRLQKEVAVLKKLKLSGYVQAQYQHAGERGIKTFAGGDFPAQVRNRFTVRRGRIKVTYENEVTHVTLQIDVTERGVAVRDAFLKLSDPWTKWLSLTGGLFVRPFNYELLYSSSLRESPERARVTQVLFPGERDVGAMVSIQPPPEHELHILRLDAGIVNGAGLSLDFDSRKDVFGKLSLIENSADRKLNYMAGVSFYAGGVRQTTDTLYRMRAGCFETKIDSSEYDRYARRNYLGADAQVRYRSKPGTTVLRGEFSCGIQSGTHSSNTSFTRIPDTHIYERRFYGAIVYLVQGFFDDRHQLVVKYDFFDPNADAAGDEMQEGCGLTSTDLRYHTIGFGYIWNPNKYLRFMAYYDWVKNETAPALGLTDDIQDNVLTVRAQVKF